MTLVDRVIAAHGGLERWRRATAVRLHLSQIGRDEQTGIPATRVQ